MLIATCLSASGGWRHGSSARLLVPPGDDAAVLANHTAITTDTLVEQVHFDERCAPEDVGFKSLAVSVSDLAAMGAVPTWCTLSLSLPSSRGGWGARFATGLAEACERWRVALIGGDTTGSPGPIMVSVTAGGTCVASPLTRANAKPGDDLWVTGVLGLAGAGWRASHPPAPARAAWLRPCPPAEFAAALGRAQLPHAMMDLSDGLGQDLPKLCARSRVGAHVDPQRLPAHECLTSEHLPGVDEVLLDLQLFGGEDYQLLFTAPPSARRALRHLANAYDVAVHRIGHITSKTSLHLGNAPWPAGGFDHFSEVAS
jgi:thiamine-monophosphate kinase